MGDIGYGDVVEAIHDFYCDPIKRGNRRRVVGFTATDATCWHCREVKGLHGIGLYLDPSEPYIKWCPNHWRKVGGSQADTSRLFAEDLIIKVPELEPA